MAKVTVEPLAFLFILTVFCEFTAVQEMISTHLCHQIRNDTSSSRVETCDRTSLDSDQKLRLSSEMSSEMMRYMGIFSFSAILASLFTGSWSDLLGRKPLLLLPSALGLVAEILFAITSVYLAKDQILVLVYIASLFNGMSGGSTTAMASCFGYITDITDSRSRTHRIVLLESAFFAGGFIGYNTAGQLLKHVVGIRFQYIFCLCFFLHLSIIGYTLTLSETRGPKRDVSLHELENRESIEDDKSQKIFSLDHVKRMFMTISRRGRRRKNILMLYVCGFISFLAMSVQTTLLFTYVKSPPLNWDSSRYSLYSGINFFITGLFLMALIPLLYRIWPTLPDAALALIGFASKLFALLNLGLSSSTVQVFAGLALFSCAEYTMPSIRSMLSKQVDDDERGKAFAFLGVIQNLCQFFGSIIFPVIYRSTLSLFPGLAFEVAGASQLIAILLIILIHKWTTGN